MKTSSHNYIEHRIAVLESIRSGNRSYREIAADVGLSLTTVWSHVQYLCRAGSVASTQRKHRTVVAKGGDYMKVGTISCAKCHAVLEIKNVLTVGRPEVLLKDHPNLKDLLSERQPGTTALYLPEEVEKDFTHQGCGGVLKLEEIRAETRKE